MSFHSSHGSLTQKDSMVSVGRLSWTQMLKRNWIGNSTTWNFSTGENEECTIKQTDEYYKTMVKANPLNYLATTSSHVAAMWRSCLDNRVHVLIMILHRQIGILLWVQVHLVNFIININWIIKKIGAEKDVFDGVFKCTLETLDSAGASCFS